MRGERPNSAKTLLRGPKPLHECLQFLPGIVADGVTFSKNQAFLQAFSAKMFPKRCRTASNGWAFRVCRCHQSGNLPSTGVRQMVESGIGGILVNSHRHAGPNPFREPNIWRG